MGRRKTRRLIWGYSVCLHGFHQKWNITPKAPKNDSGTLIHLIRMGKSILLKWVKCAANSLIRLGWCPGWLIWVFSGWPKPKLSLDLSRWVSYLRSRILTLKAPNTTIAEFANTADPDEMAHNEPSHLDLQCLPSKLWFFNIKQFLLKDCRNFADVILSSAFLAF